MITTYNNPYSKINWNNSDVRHTDELIENFGRPEHEQVVRNVNEKRDASDSEDNTILLPGYHNQVSFKLDECDQHYINCDATLRKIIIILLIIFRLSPIDNIQFK